MVLLDTKAAEYSALRIESTYVHPRQFRWITFAIIVHRKAPHRGTHPPRRNRYGQAIGYANRAIAVGSWIREDLIDMPLPPPLDRLRSRRRSLPRPNRSPVSSSRAIAIQMAASARAIFSASQPPSSASRPPWNMPPVASKPSYCRASATSTTWSPSPTLTDAGVAINAPGAAVPISTLRHISLHANLAAQPLVVSLGCEKMQPALLFSNDFPVLETSNVIRLQDHRGFSEMSRSSWRPPRNGWRFSIAAVAKLAPHRI